MPDKKHEVYIQAKAFVDALARMPDRDKSERPSTHYGEQYNGLRALAVEERTDLDARSWPPQVGVRHDARPALNTTSATYAEIETYARLILGHFPANLAVGNAIVN